MDSSLYLPVLACMEGKLTNIVKLWLKDIQFAVAELWILFLWILLEAMNLGYKRKVVAFMAFYVDELSGFVRNLKHPETLFNFFLLCISALIQILYIGKYIKKICKRNFLNFLQNSYFFFLLPGKHT